MLKMRNYMKKNRKKIESEVLLTEELLESVSVPELPCNKGGVRRGIGVVFTLLSVSLLATCGWYLYNQEMSEITVGEQESITFESAPVTAAAGKKSVITIPNGTVKANPFVPYRDITGTVSTSSSDVPSSILVAPPEVANENSDAARVMDTIVSGILFDKYSPSAILNIEGSDYLVKKGDVVNNYKVVNIAQDSVTVSLGANVYKAGIGEILTEGTLNHNDVSNLSNKFGGER